MLFNIEFDQGNLLEGYLIPDGFSETPWIKVVNENDEIGTFPCDKAKPAVVASGRHETGLVGFRLDVSKIPDLSALSKLAIHDLSTGVLIYRRPTTAPILRKIFRLETQLVPMTRFDRYCGQLFQYELASMERLGHETTLQAFHLNSINSIYLSGRLLLRNYEEFLGKGFEAITLLSDPYYEMALRIFLLKRMAHSQISFFAERDQFILGPAVQYFSGADLEDRAAMKKLLKRAPPNVISILSSPITSQLSLSSPEQRVARNGVAPAIDLLSRFTIIGHHKDIITFQRAVSELLDVKLDDLIVPSPQPVLQKLANLLGTLSIAESILEEDLILDHYVRQAMKSSFPTVREIDVEQQANNAN